MALAVATEVAVELALVGLGLWLGLEAYDVSGLVRLFQVCDDGFYAGQANLM